MFRQSFVFSAFVLTAFTAACGGPEAVPTGTVSSPIINGTDSTSAQDAVVMIQVEGGSAGGVCTGSLIAPNLVLTARHCVSSGSDKGFACTQEGVGAEDAEASKPGADYAPTAFKFFTGPQAPAEGATPRAVGKKVIHDGATSLCNHDLALILLDQSLTDVPLAKMRLDGPVVVGETMTAVGWGVTNTEAPTPAVRKQRTGVKVARIGPGEALPSSEFEVGEAICSGDSGGPALADPSGDVLGVVSRGGNDSANDPNDIAKGCINGTNIYTSLAPFKALIEGALAEASGTPSTPAPPGAPGSTTPAGASDPADSGCAIGPAPAPRAPAGFALLGAAVVGLAARRRTKRGAR